MVQKISAVIIAWNGEKEIKKCLDSIKNVVSEIIVLHDGKCSDKTPTIVKGYGAKYKKMPYIGEAEPHRNHGFNLAKNDWILWIDQDEQLSKPLQKALKNFEPSPDISAYTLLWSVKYGNKWLNHGYFSRVPKLCLFRKSRMLKFNGLPNECIKVVGKVWNTNYRMIHKPFGERNTIKVFFNRTKRIVKIHAEQMIKKKVADMPSIWYLLKAPLWFVLYLGYYFVLKRTIKSKADISITVQNALYNYYLYWYVFKILWDAEEKAYANIMKNQPIPQQPFGIGGI